MSPTASSVAEGLASRAAELRREFDRAFAEPVRLGTTIGVDLLGIEVGAQRYAMRLSEIAGLYAGKKVTRVPGGTPGLLGIAGFRSALVPVYDLHAVLGHAGTHSPRWLVIASTAPIALAFEAFVGQLRVARGDIVPHASRQGPQSCAHELVRTDNFIGPVLHLPSVIEAIKGPGIAAARKEE